MPPITGAGPGRGVSSAATMLRRSRAGCKGAHGQALVVDRYGACDRGLGSSTFRKNQRWDGNRLMRSTRAEKYREEAVRLRDEAERAKPPDIRRQLLDIAAQYDRLAGSIERMLQSY